MSSDERFTSVAVKSWKLVIGRLNDLIEAADEEKLERQVAQDRNRVLYIVGHLTAVHDRLFPMLGLGERLHPELDAVCLSLRDPQQLDPVAQLLGQRDVFVRAQRRWKRA